ncbi:expressed unknown protein [Seminavis robusta]|uniref:Uncharacterized protein n=1 Tax=Seminavis robusta TaxID=568900 RepID=A0A9N8DII3_9STRA|nr:expressed unknown protein [Seminavis robusta]|eukprot:Sro104_g052740.1 n/a (744) ;mRNA; r:31490-33721
MAEQNCWRVHEAIVELQQVLGNVHPSTLNHQAESSVGGNTTSNSNNKSVIRANVVRRCLRKLDLEMDKIALAMEQQQQYNENENENDETSESELQLPDRHDLLWIMTELDLRRLVSVESQCDEYMRSTSLKVCEKAKQFLDQQQLEEGVLGSEEACQVINALLRLLNRGRQKGVTFFNNHKDDIEHTGMLLALFNAALCHAEDQQRQQEDQEWNGGGDDEEQANPAWSDDEAEEEEEDDDDRSSSLDLHYIGSSSSNSSNSNQQQNDSQSQGSSVVGLQAKHSDTQESHQHDHNGTNADDEQHDQENDTESMASKKQSCFEVVLGGEFELVEFLGLFLALARDCLRDQDGSFSPFAKRPDLYCLEPESLHLNAWMIADFLLKHVRDSMKAKDCCTVFGFLRSVLRCNLESDDEDDECYDDYDDAAYAEEVSDLVDMYSDELLKSASAFVIAATTILQRPPTIPRHNDGNSSTKVGESASSSVSIGGGSCDTPSTLSDPLSQSSSLASNETQITESENEILEPFNRNASHTLAKLANFVGFVDTALQVSREGSDPVNVDSLRSLWKEFIKAFLGAKDSLEAIKSQLTEEADMASTDALLRLGQHALANMQQQTTNVDDMGMSSEWEPALQHALCISLLGAVDFPQLLLENDEQFLSTIEYVSARNAEVRHLIQGVVLRGLVLPTKGGARHPIAMELVLEKLVNIGKTSEATTADVDYWDQFFCEQVAQLQRTSRPAVSTAVLEY